MTKYAKDVLPNKIIAGNNTPIALGIILFYGTAFVTRYAVTVPILPI